MMDNLKVGNVYKNVLIGKDNYLFLYDGGQQQIAHLIGEKYPSVESVCNFYENIYNRQLYCKFKNIKYLHLIYPSKPVICINKLPEDLADKVNSLYYYQYYKFIKNRDFIFINNQCINVKEIKEKIFYPYFLLKNLNNDNSVFRILDTHCNDYGFIHIAKYILSLLNLENNVEYFFAKKQQKIGGDLANMIKSDLKVDEVIYSYSPPKNINIKNEITIDNRIFLPGNSNTIKICHNPNSIYTQRLLIFGDSFINTTIIFLKPFFRDILYIRSTTFQTDIIELFSPDVIISSNAERYLSKVENDKNSNMYLMELYGDKNYHPTHDFKAALTAQLSYKHHKNIYDDWINNINKN